MNRYHFYHNLQGRPSNGIPTNSSVPSPAPAPEMDTMPRTTPAPGMSPAPGMVTAPGTSPAPGGEMSSRVPCNPGSGKGLEGRSLAMVYSPKQYYRMLYQPEEALRNGTLFRELNLPFTAIGGNRK